jgi:hypothetical protein
MTGPVPSEVRFRVDPADVPPEKAARRLHLTLERFNEVLPRLLARGFPPADPDTGCFDLEAIDQWRKLRTPALFGLTPVPSTGQVEATQEANSMGDRFATAKPRYGAAGGCCISRNSAARRRPGRASRYRLNH